MTVYRERLRPSMSMFLSIALVIPASMTVFTPIATQAAVPGIVIGIIVGVILYVGVIGLLVGTSPVIEVTEKDLRVGRATIPLELIGTVDTFEGDDATAQRGLLLDARAWLCIRGWVRPVIRIEISDPADPAPYWLVSTRNPQVLIQLLAPPTLTTQV